MKATPFELPRSGRQKPKPKKKKPKTGPFQKTKPKSQETYGPGKKPLPLRRPKTSNKRPRATPLRSR